VFVKNRIVEIKSEERIQFKYVPSKQNPADLATRGRSVESLRNDNLWWHGPEWLDETDSETILFLTNTDKSFEVEIHFSTHCESVHNNTPLKGNFTSPFTNFRHLIPI
jgi:hypothetical protein